MIEPTAAAAFEALLARRGGDLLILVDDTLRIVRAGPEAAARSPSADETELIGMSLIAAFGSASLDAVARQALAADEATTGEADAWSPRRPPVRGRRGAPADGGGLVLSLHDVTALRRMERVRRDFVANIGHELRTPLTSIKLLAETPDLRSRRRPRHDHARLRDARSSARSTTSRSSSTSCSTSR